MNSKNMDLENLSVCETCGKPYLNFCVPCAKKLREELVEQLMNDHGMTVESLVALLGEEVIAKKNFAALKLAIELKSMKPPVRTDVTSDGKPLFDDLPNVQSRLTDKIARVIKSGSEKQAD